MSHRDNTIKLLNIFTIDAMVDRAKIFRSSNIQLLFHGTNISNIASILSNGMKIRPKNVMHSGSMFGNGIYFANTVSKSAGYLGLNKKGSGLLLLCEVDLGKCITKTKCTSAVSLSYDDDIRDISVHGIGQNTPNIKTKNTLGKATVPIGTLKPSGVSAASVYCDEYVTYSVDNVKIKYISDIYHNIIFVHFDHYYI